MKKDLETSNIRLQKHEVRHLGDASFERLIF